VVKVVDERKGEDILLLDITGLDTFTDYFVFCSGTSDRQLDALQESVLGSVKKSFGAVLAGKEGTRETEWMLLDFGDVIVNLFSPEKRAYYDLEELWKEGKVVIHIQ
jgi:ribosome-associated protein